jgi:hypothetical protein
MSGSKPRNYLKRGRPQHGLRGEHRPMTHEELKAYRASLPSDDRDSTAKHLGDPPSWRSALAQRQA